MVDLTSSLLNCYIVFTAGAEHAGSIDVQFLLSFISVQCHGSFRSL